jgi:6-pyruvoyltetrahydropterin/6-carboxytetrahydropterin synthase
MKLIVSKTFRFEAAHSLPYYIGDCAKLHGHSYTLEVCVKNEVNEETGFVMDFKELKKIVQEKVIVFLDHEFLNNLFKNPTAENTLIWIVRQLQNEINIVRARLWETADSYVEWGNAR